jgi:hypothetical protein
VAQIGPDPAFNHKLVDRVIAYLQTRDHTLFPFTAGFDEERERAFRRDLQVGLSDLTESGSKRGTSAAGFLVSDKRLKEIVAEWVAAGGDWPEGSDPRDADTALAALENPETGTYDTEAPTQSYLSGV